MKVGSLVRATEETLRNASYGRRPYMLTPESRGLVAKLFSAGGPFVRVIWLEGGEELWMSTRELEEIT